MSMLKAELEAEIKTLEFVRLEFIEVIKSLESERDELQAKATRSTKIASNKCTEAGELQVKIETLEGVLFSLGEQNLADCEKLDDEIIDLKIERTSLIKKLEAVESIFDSIAHSTNTGLQVTEL
jgi:hypothetical protein